MDIKLKIYKRGKIKETDNNITNINSGFKQLPITFTKIKQEHINPKDIKQFSQGLPFINDLNPVKFTWNMRNGGKVDLDEFGFIAQDLLKTQSKFGNVPNLVHTNDPNNLLVSQGTLIPIIVKAIQELSKKVDLLTA